MRNRKGGFTLVEVLLAVALLALLTALVGGVLVNCRRTAAAAKDTLDVLRRRLVIRETLQQELELAQSRFTFESFADRVRGFSFVSFGRFGGKHLKIRSRYAFEKDPVNPGYQLVRYAVADGIGVRETKEILFEGIHHPEIEAYSEAAGDFVAIEQMPFVPSLIRLKFRMMIDPSKSDEPGKQAEDFRLILNNPFAPQNAPEQS